MKSIALHLRKECKNQKVRCTNFLSSSVFIALFLFMGFYATAQTSWTVTSTADTGVGTLRTLIVDSASAGDTIRFSSVIDGDSIVLTNGEIIINRDIILLGNGAGNTIIDGNGTNRVLNISDSVTVEINGMAIQNGFLSSRNDSGGGVSNAGSLKIVECEIRSSRTHVLSVGGGIYNTGKLSVFNSTLSGNLARQGGAIFSQFGDSCLLSNVTISGNKATSDGGGIYILSTPTTISNSTITLNESSLSKAAGIKAFSSTLFLKNSIVAGNIGLQGEFFGAGAQADPSSSYNLLSDTTSFSMPIGNNNIVGTAAHPINARLDLLSYNGGSTPTHALLCASPALNNGRSGLLTDQRGQPRGALGADDIGAFELQVVPPATTIKIVTSATDNSYGSLRRIINEACVNDTILFDTILNGTPLVLTEGKILLDKDIVIIGNDTSNTKIDGNNMSAIFDISTGANVIIKALTLQRGNLNNSISGVVDNCGTLSMVKVRVTKNVFSGSGVAGVNNNAGAYCKLEDCKITHNGGRNATTLLNNYGANLIIVNSEISHNQGKPGAIASGGNLEIRLCTLDSNQASSFGGAILSLGHLRIDSCNFRGNNTDGDGGAIYTVDTCESLSNTSGTCVTSNVSVISNSMFSFNQAEGSGGAIYQSSGKIMIEDSKFDTNATDYNGGALYLKGRSTVLSSTFFKNACGGNGGGIYKPSGKLMIDGSTFEGNKSGFTHQGGGALYTGDSSIISNSTFLKNDGAERAGAIYQDTGYIMLYNATISGNIMARWNFAEGGGIYFNGGVGFIENSTITLNNVRYGKGGGIFQNGGTLTYRSSIIAKNSALSLGKDGYKNQGTVSPSSSYNLVGKKNNFGMPVGNFNQLGTNGQPLNPGLDELADNGGPTLTHALLPCSPAINNGYSDFLFDQRGLPRSQFGGTDIGALEAEVNLGFGKKSTVTSIADNGPGTLRYIISIACPTDTIVFDPSLNGDTIVLTTGEIKIDRNLTIIGNGALSTIIDGNGIHRVFNISDGDTVEIKGMAIQNGFVSSLNDSSGAGVYNEGNLKISDCELRRCNAPNGPAGGIYNTGKLSVLNSALIGNHASKGGAIFSDDGDSCLLNNVTISGNLAANLGGGIYVLATPTIILNSTITLNSAMPAAAGGIEVIDAPFLLKNSIVAGNLGRQGNLSGLGVHADPASSYNLISDTTGFFMPIGNNNKVGTANDSIDALLDTLNYNGGHTLTHRPRCHSPAVNKGNSGVLTDQRGQPRGVWGADDIGAYELQPSASSVKVVSSVTDNTPGSLRRVVFEACFNDTIMFDTTLNGTPIVLTGGGIVLDIPLVVIGNGPSNTIIDGNGNSDIFIVEPNTIVQIEGIQLQGADAQRGQDGSAIVNNGDLKVRNVLFKNNSSQEIGGGLSNLAGAVCNISHSLFENNIASRGTGGAIYNEGTLTMKNSTISSQHDDAVIYSSSGSMLIEFSTIVRKESGVVVRGGVFTMHNSIIAGKSDSYYAIEIFGSGKLDTSSSNNLVDIDNVLSTGKGNLLGVLFNPLNPRLGPLADNGGATKTFALLTCSPAFNAALTDTTTDQRGFPRNQFGGTDIGAFESEFNIGTGQKRVVTTLANNGAGSLREMAGLSCSTDTIIFDKSLNGDTILLTGGEIKISTNLTIIGNGADSTIIDGANFKEILDIQNTAIVSIEGLTLQNGRGESRHASAITNRGSITLTNSRISKNVSGTLSSYGAIYNTDSATCQISNCELWNNNQGSGNGGAINNDDYVQCVVLNSSIINNQAMSGGAIYNRGILAVINCQIDSNEIVNNRQGGGIYNSGTALVISSTFTGNKAKGHGSGGAIYSTGKLILKTSILNGNIGSDGGSEGGGIYNRGVCDVSSSSIINNTAGNGGGIFSDDPITIFNTTISGNMATVGDGGGLNADAQNISILNSTITNNHAHQGGGIYCDRGTLYMHSSIVAGNTATNASADGYLFNATIDTNSSYNLIGIDENFAFPAGNFNKVGTSANPLWPGLDTLADNGGPTLTHALLPSSPAFDAGHSDSLTDQRGHARGAFCRDDIGAFESQLNLDTASFTTQLSLHCDFMISPTDQSLRDTNGFFIDSLVNRYGCDSIVAIKLQINSPAYTVLDTFAYHSFTSPSGKYTWTESGSYMDTTIDSNGCGRVYHINLSINCDWKAPGFASNNRVTTQSAGTTRIVFDNTNTPYIVFRDRVLDKARVRSFDGTSWKNVGGQGFSAGDVSSTDIAIDKNGVLYVAFRDFTQGNKVTVMKYADTSWVIVGSAGLSAGGSEYISLVLDTSGTPMVGYRDAANGFRATVQKFNSGTNTWGVLGSAGFSPAGANHIAMATDPAGAPYIVFRDGNFTDRNATAMKYNGSSWDIVDTAGFTAGRAQFNDIAIDASGTPYVVYQDNAFENKASVKKLVGGHWQTVGTEGFSDGAVEHTRIAIDPAGIPHVVYRDSATQQATVMTFTNNQWGPLGSQNFSPGGSSFTSIAIDTDGNPMVALTQGGVRAYSYSCVSGYQQLTECDSILSLNGTEFWTETGMYHDTLQNGLGHDSIVAVALELTESSDTTFSASACYSYISPSGLYIWDSSGVFTDTLTNIAGCDSVITVSLSINVSDTTLSITSCDSVVSPSGLYTWNSSGTYMDTLQNSNGCDSLITANVTVHPSTTSTISPTACYTYSSPSGLYIWNTSGTYLDTVTNGNGCDSVITVNLTLNVNDTTLNFTGCDSVVSPSGLYTWISSGTYMDTLQNSNGCDSLITANVTVHPSTTSTISPTACYTYSSPSGLYIWNTSGTYLDTVTNGNGCDSVITVNLTLNVNDTTLNFTGCDSVVSPSGLYTWISSGTYMDTLQNSNGCDSLITANVTVHPSTTSTISPTACYSYSSPSGLYIWNTSGTYLDTVTNGNGCDSVITVNLTLNVNDTTLSLTGCDSVVSPSRLYTWTSTGTYIDTLQNVNGCDSLITANVTINPCPVDCQMGTWSAWSACDTSCGGGTRFRTRDILVQAAYGGLSCGDTIEYDTCNTQPCCTTTNTFFTDSICLGDSLFVANAWQTTIGTYVDSAVSVLGCDSLLHTSLYFKDSSSCIVDSTVETILYLVSDSAWTLSTVVTVETSNSYPWPGAVAYLPHDSTFILPVEVGQPYSWTHLYTVMGSEVITSRSGVTYYRYQFDLTEHETLNARFRMFVDDNMQIFINRHEIALEDDMGKVNWRTANHDLHFDDTGAIFNGYNGGDPFDYYTLTNLDSVFQTGANDIILAIRNRTSKPDIGGFSFRMDLDKAGKAVIVKKDEEITQGATSLGIVVYPNPTTGWLQVKLINGQDEGTLNVLDVAGRLLMQKKMSQSTELNLESFSQGVYLVRVASGGRSYTVRVVKN